MILQTAVRVRLPLPPRGLLDVPFLPGDLLSAGSTHEHRARVRPGMPVVTANIVGLTATERRPGRVTTLPARLYTELREAGGGFKPCKLRDRSRPPGRRCTARGTKRRDTTSSVIRLA